MPELLIDFITSLDGCAAADGWPGWWGLEGPEYLAWLGEQPEADYTVLMGAVTYRVMSGYAAEGEPGTDVLAGLSKVVFSATLSEPLSWANTRFVAQDPVEAVREMKDKASNRPIYRGMARWYRLAGGGIKTPRPVRPTRTPAMRQR
jgi:dihydrofolate reductase